MALTFQQADYDLYELSVERPTPSVVLATSRSEMDPAWSPSGSELAFTTDRAGHAEIWVRSREGIERPLATPAEFRREPDLPSELAGVFSRRQAHRLQPGGPGRHAIWITPVAGGPPIPLAPTEHARPGLAELVAGRRVGRVRARDSTEWSLSKMRVGGKAPEMVVADIAALLARAVVAQRQDGLPITVRRPGARVARTARRRASSTNNTWMAFTWSADGQRIFGIRLSDDFQHLTFTSVDVRSGAEHVLGPDFMTLPVSARLVRGMTRTSPTTFVASIVDVRSDVWLLEGFLPPPSLWERLASALPFGR